MTALVIALPCAIHAPAAAPAAADPVLRASAPVGTRGNAAPVAEEFVIDPRHSSVEFRIRHLGVSTVIGRFHDWSGSVAYDAGDPEESRVEVSIDVASIDTGVQQRDDHLRSGDFFDVEQYPEMRFVSREVRPVGDGMFGIVGDLTIRDTTREVVLDAEMTGMIERDGRGGRIRTMGFSASTRIVREEFGLTWNRALEAGGWLVGSEVRILIEIEANHQLATTR